MAAKYDKPVMIHVSDSIRRFYPIGPKNERFEAGLWEKPGNTTEKWLLRLDSAPDLRAKRAGSAGRRPAEPILKRRLLRLDSCQAREPKASGRQDSLGCHSAA